VTLGITAMGRLLLALIFVPPPTFVVAMFAALLAGSPERRTMWRRLAWVFGLLSLVSVALVVWFIHDFNHAFDGD
jgi:hypothetical protein